MSEYIGLEQWISTVRGDVIVILIDDFGEGFGCVRR